MKNKILNYIHELSIENKIYSTLYFGGNNEKIEDVTFYYQLRKNDNIKLDIKFILNNIIAKIFELNYNIFYNRIHRSDMGGTVYFEDCELFIPYLAEDYKFKEPINIANIDEFIDDIEIIDKDDNMYIFKWKIPIFKLDKEKIE